MNYDPTKLLSLLQSSGMPTPSLPHEIRGPAAYSSEVNWILLIAAIVAFLVIFWGIKKSWPMKKSRKSSRKSYNVAIEELQKIHPKEPFDKKSQIDFLAAIDLHFRVVWAAYSQTSADASTYSEIKKMFEENASPLIESEKGEVLEILKKSELIKFSKKTLSKDEALDCKKRLLAIAEDLVRSLDSLRKTPSTSEEV